MSARLSSPVVSTQWLADHLGAERMVVLDASVLSYETPAGGRAWLSGYDSYLFDGHVPGAYFADLIEEFSEPGAPHPFTRPTAARFEAAAGALGIGRDTTVLIYDVEGGNWAPRLWWLFRAFGHDDVAVVDGGLAKWRGEEREVETGHNEPSPATFVAEPREELWVDRAFVEAVLRGDEDAALLCAVPAGEFTGEAATTRPRPGVLPGSVSVPAAQLRDASSKLLDGASLRSILAPVLGAPRVVAYCGAGIAAASDALALTLLGYRNVAIYDGSLNEWAADPDAPLVLGDPPAPPSKPAAARRARAKHR
ncbi:sulfurtransferase [Planctomonas deserti]|uniref:sulfurtransferase n=1 Tax=Planctomonas deserti TaxID=2144185 RepID=UPI000D38036C|nr:rhodanese-like domain-containing protein [Planctomonas deserti]